MIIAWASDIHFDFMDDDQAAGFLERIHDSGSELLLLGGDIATAARLGADLMGTLEIVRQPLFFVLGNHDYYGGSIKRVRKWAAAQSGAICQWLPGVGPQAVTDGVTVVGHGGWGDARNGDFAGSGVVLNDYVMISELAAVFDRRQFAGTFGRHTPLEKELRKLGRNAANVLSPQLEMAAIDSRQVIILTHVPPFPAACWHEGEISGPDWLPAFSCGAVGEILLDAAQAYPDRSFTVLCGHTHSPGTARILDNLVVHTLGADYGQPSFQLLDVSQDAVGLL